MQLTTRTLLTNETIQSRMRTLADGVVQDLSAKQQVLVESVTVVAVTNTGMVLLQSFCEQLQSLGWTVTVLTIPEKVSAQWFLEHQSAWCGSCVLFQDVSTTGETLEKIANVFSQFLHLPILTCCMFKKTTHSQSNFKVEYIGFSIPNDFIVGCGLPANGQFQERTDVSVLI